MIPVTRHPFSEWVADSLGEGRTKSFGEDVGLFATVFDPGGSSTLRGSTTDTPVASNPTLYFRGQSIDASGHDEWTVDGLRYLQDGDAAKWRRHRTNRVAGTVIHLRRRTG